MRATLTLNAKAEHRRAKAIHRRRKEIHRHHKWARGWIKREGVRRYQLIGAVAGGLIAIAMVLAF